MGDVSPPVINADDEIYTVAFTPNGEYLVSGGDKGVRVWRVQDGAQMAAMNIARLGANCLAISRDGRWIAGGAEPTVAVWDANTYRRVFAHRHKLGSETFAVDFSPESTRLVASGKGTATVWSIPAGKEIFTLDHNHEDKVEAARYAPQGDRIATATVDCVRVWDSNDGTLLLDVKVHHVVSYYNDGLCWFDDRLFLVSNSKIKEIDAYTGATVSAWPVPDCGQTTCVVLPQHGKFIASSSKHIITFWHASTHAPLYCIRQYQDVNSIAVSPDDRFLAVARNGKIVMKSLSNIMSNHFPRSFLHLEEPEIHLTQVALDLWRDGKLADAEASLQNATTPVLPRYHILACRALIRTRSWKWDAAMDDAEESIKLRGSVIGYIAKCVALVGRGKMREAMRVCDIAFVHFPSLQVTFLLVKAVVLFMAGEHEDAMARVDDLIDAMKQNTTFYVVKAYMFLLVGNTYMKNKNYKYAIRSFKHARIRRQFLAGPLPLIISLMTGWKCDNIGLTVRQHLCEALYTDGRAKEASDEILDVMNTFADEIEPVHDWVADFIRRCLSALQNSDEDMSLVQALSRGWAKVKLEGSPWKDVLAAAIGSKFVVYQVICEHLAATNRIADALDCLSQISRETSDQQEIWSLDFRSRCFQDLMALGDAAINARQYDEAISQFSLALSLNPSAPQDLFARRSKAYAGKGLWEDALNDAHRVTAHDPSSPLGYEMQHVALRGARQFDAAAEAFETMVSKMSQSPHPDVRDRAHQYITPTKAKETIRAAVRRAISVLPPELIHTRSGRLLDKSAQALLFESDPVFGELISDMTTEVDYARMEREVTQFYRYAMFSHKWEDNEPLYEKVVQGVVFDLEELPTHRKLQMFCKTVREAGFNWAWSDTCCIKKGDHFVLQEALVSMFKWYEASAMTIIFLLGVSRHARRGSLAGSIWNSRGWTLQEYHASRVVRFYTEDWTPYLNLDHPNHKESLEIISEMEDATRVSARALMALRPGLGDIREKLRLASTRETTRVEDAAYSLLGIFSVSMPVTYGEGDRALGRLLALLLTSSGDTNILAWTGLSGSFNSCLPASIAVFKEPPTSHIPSTMTTIDLGVIDDGLHASSIDMRAIMELYERLNDLPVPSFAGQRLRLPCLSFKLGTVSATRNGSERVFRAQTTALGVVEIKTKVDLSRLGSLYLVHPWVDFLLDRHAAMTIEGVEWSRAQKVLSWAEDTSSLRPPSLISPAEMGLRALGLVARLRQPFGALLLWCTRGNVEYRRVVSEALITVQVEAMTPGILERLMESVRVLDVL